jgi:two-component system cell cycle response regulator DivK
MDDTNLKKPVILVTEDDVSNFLVIEVMIHQYVKASVIWAKDGAEAVEICKENPAIDLVLMDIKLPLMNGIEATKAIKQLRPSLPIVAITAYALLGDERRVKEAGCDDYLAKPIRLPLFLQTIGKYVVLLK